MQGVDFFLSALDEGGERGSHSRTCFFPPRLKDGQSICPLYSFLQLQEPVSCWPVVGCFLGVSDSL